MAVVPVVDIFAGPGGLGEGFSSIRREGQPTFKIVLSIEKDPLAHKTLELRNFFRQFPLGEAPVEYYSYVRGELTDRDELFHRYPDEAEAAKREAWLHTLGEDSHKKSSQVIADALKRAGSNGGPWALIGGPPCQVYSKIGRSRMRGQNPEEFEQDHRHLLYKEYLRILVDHAPAVFVLENVPGLLSSKYDQGLIFGQIQEDLSTPGAALGKSKSRRGSGSPEYRIVPVSPVKDGQPSLEGRPDDFVVKAEEHGVPQARHRVILLGIRRDLMSRNPTFVSPRLALAGRRVAVKDVLGDLPRLRSGLSKDDSCERWQALVKTSSRHWGRDPYAPPDIRQEAEELLGCRELPESLGASFIPGHAAPAFAPEWYCDERLGGFLNHEARNHMDSDVHRYVYAASFARARGLSPKLGDFPDCLLPNHANVDRALNGHLFNDRFRVQVPGSPASTVTSHISRDGHYYIHFDPTQGRSLTVREAARLQSFPDNYFFEGARTSQYGQVGNAVPPLLARQIAELVADIMDAL